MEILNFISRAIGNGKVLEMQNQRKALPSYYSLSTLNYCSDYSYFYSLLKNKEDSQDESEEPDLDQKDEPGKVAQIWFTREEIDTSN